MPNQMSASTWLLVVILSLLWGGSFIFAELALEALPPFTLVFLRVAIAAIALHLIVLATGNRLPTDHRLWGCFFIMGLLNNCIPFSLLFWGQTFITASLASILNATTPIFTVLVAHALTKDEKITPLRGLGVAFGFAGVAVMMGIDALAGLGDNIIAQIACLTAALSYAFAGVFGRRFKNIKPLYVATGQLTATSIIMFFLVIFVDQSWQLGLPHFQVWIAVILLALASTALAYMIFFKILADAGATNLALVTFLIPVSAIFMGAVYLGERIELQHYAGMFLIVLGLIAIDGRLLKRFRKHE